MLTPLGAWQVVAYRFAEGDPKDVKTTPQLDRLIGHFGIDWKSIGIRPEDARTIDVRCETSEWQPSQSLLVKDNNKEELLMLWDGVFLVLKRTDGSGTRGVGLPGIKRRP